jgi:hypothetical protein
VQRRGEDVVELAQVARRRSRSASNRPGCWASFSSAFGFIERRNMRV